MPSIDGTTREFVRHRARDHCEYCQLPKQYGRWLPFHVEHVRPRQHGGEDGVENLAYSCQQCNLRKGPNLSGVDSQTGRITRLFNPRKDSWLDHFEWQGVIAHGKTAIGRTTVRVLDLNDERRVLLRRTLRRLRKFPPRLDD